MFVIRMKVTKRFDSSLCTVLAAYPTSDSDNVVRLPTAHVIWKPQVRYRSTYGVVVSLINYQRSYISTCNTITTTQLSVDPAPPQPLDGSAELTLASAHHSHSSLTATDHSSVVHRSIVDVYKRPPTLASDLHFHDYPDINVCASHVSVTASVTATRIAVIRMRSGVLILLVCSTVLHLSPPCLVSAFSPSQYDVEWTEPSDLETESMPLGNGDLAMQTWVERSTGDLLYYAQPSSSFEENGQLLKLIRGRLHITPTNTSTHPTPATPSLSSTRPARPSVDAPLVQNFHQRLHLLNMSQTISYTLSPSLDVSISVWVDRYRPVIHFTVTTSVATTATVSVEMWRTVPTSMDWWSWGYYCANDTTNVDPDTFVPSGLGLAPHRSRRTTMVPSQRPPRRSQPHIPARIAAARAGGSGFGGDGRVEE